MTDVRVVIKDANVINRIWASWHPRPQAPTNNPAPGPALRVETGGGGFAKPTITTIHEIDHILQERNLGDTFWATGSIIAGKADSGGKVTGYAGQNKKEFVAEVFAGMIIGKQWGNDVLDEFTGLGGPKIGGFTFLSPEIGKHRLIFAAIYHE